MHAEMYDNSHLKASDEEYHMMRIFVTNGIYRSNYFIPSNKMTILQQIDDIHLLSPYKEHLTMA